MTKTVYPAGVPIHFYSKAIDGQGIFYRTEDKLVFLTSLSCIVRKYDLDVISFCLMFNHFHLLVKVKSCSHTLKAIAEFKKEFTRQYNLRYGRNGRLFTTPTGWAAKDTLKKLRGCIIYICNNPVAGSLCRNALTYRWNLLAYKDRPNPFSDVIMKRHCRKKLKHCIDLIEHRYSCNQPLNYTMLENLFGNLEESELQQIHDYIVSRYNFLNYNSMKSCFSDWESALSLIESTQGSEYDLNEDYEDYSKYVKMLDIMKQLGYNSDCQTIDNLTDEDIKTITLRIYGILNPSRKQVLKFLHLTGK